MTEPERDQLVAAVFATPAGRRLLDDAAVIGKTCLTLADIATRVARARRAWSTANPDARP